ncbi:hypothetical protein DTO271D3_5886 [Paecilomyces variotii]|nr:hypothetical protein DTO169C6_4140 [Paecilomyces variotii]KAJ9246081.1 hypothetical protein DTO169E5_205 [Paecilomyces variotii]KAJ9259105.1 hypothetical protein DTO207G8_1265 [Paecilomyces variotii]KAJ9313792.1 hypothetical protein DTO271D3_5886 [Paecilomyces variotii]KAJ9383448.1 hypothetical protein DTO063F5_5284 [Paecilomyces variotii]
MSNTYPSPFEPGAFLPGGHNNDPPVSPSSSTAGYKLNHFMLRIRDPRRTLHFYIDLMGMRTVFTMNFGPCTIYYLGYPPPDTPSLPEWAANTATAHNLTRTLGLLELYHVHGTEKPEEEGGFPISTGNEPPALGFGHLGFTVPDVREALNRLKGEGVRVIKDLGEAERKDVPLSEWEEKRGVGGGEVHEDYKRIFEQIAFVADPDGVILHARLRCSYTSPSTRRYWTQTSPRTHVADDEITRLASSRRPPLTLGDLLRHGRPPLDKEALLASANFTLSLLPARLASRIQALRNLPFIVVSNPHVSRIYHNYLHSLSTLLPYQQRQITNLEEEKQFAEVMADLVQTHTNTIPVLARGFLECRKYISPAEVTRFLDSHLRARIGTRLIAEQHLALHFASQPISDEDPNPPPERRESVPSNYIGVIDTALRPERIIRSCEDFVGEICELRYGVRPKLVIDGQPEASFAHVPVHIEYIITELLKNAFRATIESGNDREPIEVTIAAAPDVPGAHVQEMSETGKDSSSEADLRFSKSDGADDPIAHEAIKLSRPSSQSITIRLRDRGGGIPPEVLPHIWSYSFTTFSEDDLPGSENGNLDALNTISGAGGNGSSIAGLGYGLPLSRAYAEYFGGGIAVQSLWGWGTDVYLTLQGVGKI